MWSTSRVSSFDAVRAQYDQFPYPQAAVVATHEPAGFLRGTLNYLLRRRDDWLPPDARIWIAGCGTQQAAMWALSFPDADITATDLSGTSLGIARSIAADLGLQRVRFEQQNLADSAFEEAFDLVVSTGVIHHMPDPAVGAQALRRALRPGGACLIMTYSHMLRGPLATFRAAHRRLSRDGERADERYALMRRMLDALLSGDGCAPPGRDALATLRDQADADPPFVADALLHPIEHSYDVDGFLALLDGADLRHTAWWHPQQWRLPTYVRDAELCARWSALDEADRWRVVYHMAGYAGPLLEAVAEPRGAPERPAYDEAELLRMRLVMTAGITGHRVEGGKVVSRGRLPAFEEQDGVLRGRSRVAIGPGRMWALPADAKPLLEAFDGRRTTAEVIERLSSTRPPEVILTVIRQLLPDGVGILAPVAPP